MVKKQHCEQAQTDRMQFFIKRLLDSIINELVADQRADLDTRLIAVRWSKMPNEGLSNGTT